MGVKFLRALGEIKFNILSLENPKSLSSRSLLSLCVVTLFKIGSGSKTHLFYTCPNYALSFLLISAATESPNEIFTFLLISDVKFMILKFSRFIMSFSLILALSLQHPHTFPLPTIGVSLCSCSCPSIRRMGSCASQIPVQQFPVEVSGDCHITQVACDYPLLMVCSI